MKYYRRIIPYLRPYWHLAAVSLLLIALSSAAALLLPWPLQLLVDNFPGLRVRTLTPWVVLVDAAP